MFKLVILALSVLAGFSGLWPASEAFAAAAVGNDVDFTCDIRPILSDHCYQCHGPDEKARKAKLERW